MVNSNLFTGTSDNLESFRSPMKKIYISKKIFYLLAVVMLLSLKAAAQEKQNTREEWLYYIDKVARPVLSNIAADKLKEVMPVVVSKETDNSDQRKKAA